MKKYLLILVCFLATAGAFAQTEETIFGNEPLRSSGFGSPEVKFTRLMDNFGVLIGGRGGWIINSTFSIGGGGYGLATIHKVPVNNEVYNLRFDYGGVILEYINSSNKSVHFTANALIGGGTAATSKKVNNFFDSSDDGQLHREAHFFVIEPGVTMDLNLFKFMRIGVGASWRFIPRLDLEGVKTSHLTGPSASVTMKFGEF